MRRLYRKNGKKALPPAFSIVDASGKRIYEASMEYG